MKVKFLGYWFSITKKKPREKHMTPEEVSKTITDILPMVAVAGMVGYVINKNGKRNRK